MCSATQCLLHAGSQVHMFMAARGYEAGIYSVIKWRDRGPWISAYPGTSALSRHEHFLFSMTTKLEALAWLIWLIQTRDVNPFEIAMVFHWGTWEKNWARSYVATARQGRGSGGFRKIPSLATFQESDWFSQYLETHTHTRVFLMHCVILE